MGKKEAKAAASALSFIVTGVRWRPPGASQGARALAASDGPASTAVDSVAPAELDAEGLAGPVVQAPARGTPAAETLATPQAAPAAPVAPVAPVADSDSPDSALLETVFRTLARNTAQTAERLFVLLKSAKSEEVSAYGPFLGRSLLELGLTATLGRLDPLRLIALAKYQQAASAFDLGERNMLAVQWTGDLLARKPRNEQADEPQDGGAPSVRKVDWAKNVAPDKISRALLGGHLGEYSFRAGFAAHQLNPLPDAAQPSQLARLSPERMIGQLASQADRLFSTWSKGTHAELLMPRENYFDLETVTESALRTIDLVGTLAVLCNYSPIALNRLRQKDLAAASTRVRNFTEEV